MTKREFLEAIADVPDDAEIEFSVDVSVEPWLEMTPDEEEDNAGRRAFVSELICIQEIGDGFDEGVTIILKGELNY